MALFLNVIVCRCVGFLNLFFFGPPLTLCDLDMGAFFCSTIVS